MNYFKADGGRVGFQAGGPRDWGQQERREGAYSPSNMSQRTYDRLQKISPSGGVRGGERPEPQPIRGPGIGPGRDPQEVTRPFITKKGILNAKKFDKFLLAKLLKGKDPLYNIYEEEGLLDEGNIVNYLADLKWEDDPAGLAKYKAETAGYTRPYNRGEIDDPFYDTRLFVDEVEKFGMQPTGPLYGTGIMDTDYLESPSYRRKTIGVDKFDNKMQGRYLTNRENITELLQHEWEPIRTQALSDVFGMYNDPAEMEEEYWATADDANEYKIYDWTDEPGYGKPYQPTITERNKRLAEVIGHEARHQVLGKNPEYYESIDPTYTMKDGEKVTDRHELLNRMLDFQAWGDTGIYGDIYGTMHGDMPRHLSSPIADAYSTQATAFTKDQLRRDVPRPLFKKGGLVESRNGILGAF